MATLVMQLVGQLQSWSSTESSKLHISSLPSKSAIINLIARSMDKEHDQEIVDWLSSMWIGVREDIPGEVFIDHQNAPRPISESVDRAGDGRSIKYHNEGSSISVHEYVSGAAYLVTIESSQKDIEIIKYNLIKPKKSLYLGNKSCIPSLPVFHSSTELNAINVLRKYPQLCVEEGIGVADNILIRRDSLDSDVFYGHHRDMPLKIYPTDRRFGLRRVVDEYVSVPTSVQHDNPKESVLNRLRSNNTFYEYILTINKKSSIFKKLFNSEINRYQIHGFLSRMNPENDFLWNIESNNKSEPVLVRVRSLHPFRIKDDYLLNDDMELSLVKDNYIRSNLINISIHNLSPIISKGLQKHVVSSNDVEKWLYEKLQKYSIDIIPNSFFINKESKNKIHKNKTNRTWIINSYDISVNINYKDVLLLNKLLIDGVGSNKYLGYGMITINP